MLSGALDRTKKIRKAAADIFAKSGPEQNRKNVRIIPQTVLALRGSGGIKGGLVKGSRHQAPHRKPLDTQNVEKALKFISFLKKNVLALEF